ncbi:hypothetical protein ACFQFQ_07480 [Sulfitobacter porphyrae]|uniref:Uncharacterized protein n=1 Tax=Sulfitobacter porphyrae TaxID=1246864 RepID=A0ABW2B0Y7_9RHOB
MLILGTTAGLAQTRITPEQFMDRAVGRTLTFESMLDGRLSGSRNSCRAGRPSGPGATAAAPMAMSP